MLSRAVRRPLGGNRRPLTAGGPGEWLAGGAPGSGPRLTFSIPVPIPAGAALPAAYKRATDAMPTLPTSHSCRDTSPSCRPLSSSSIADKLPAGRAPDHTSIIWHSAAGSPARSSGGPCRAVRPAAWSSGTAAGSGGLAAVLAFPVGKIGGPAAGYLAAGSGGLVGGPVIPVGKIGPGAMAGFGGWPGLEAAKRRWPQSARAALVSSASGVDPLAAWTGLTPAKLTQRMERPGRIRRVFRRPISVESGEDFHGAAVTGADANAQPAQPNKAH